MARGQYDDAWETPGWTAQNMAYPPLDTDDFVPPEGIELVTVTGDYSSYRSRAPWGRVSFTPSVKTVTVGDTQVALYPVTKTLNNGKFETKLVKTEGWKYHVRQRVGPDILEFDTGLTADTTMAALVASNSAPYEEPDSDFPFDQDLTIYQGATWREHFQWLRDGTGMDMTGWTAKMQAKSGSTVVLDLDDSAGITLDQQGNVDLFMSDEDTSALPPGKYRYDLKLTDSDGDAIRFVEGFVTVDPEVTT